MFLSIALILSILSYKSAPVQAQSESPQPGNPAVPTDEKNSKPRWNLPIKTAGGTQVWTDHLHRDGFRVQQNVLTGHWRLLDANDVRRAWGTRQQCQVALDKQQPKTPQDPAQTNPQHTVILLHGLMRTHHSMSDLETRLKESDAIDVDVIRFSYASTRSSIGDHAAALQEVLEDLPPSTRFSFVGHSMGNIVVRHLIGDLQSHDSQRILDRCDSMVMLGPPNQGAAIARRLAPTALYGIVTGEGGLELGPKWEEFVKKLAIPPFPFAIIAGDKSDNMIQNPLVDGAGDFVVSLAEAQLDGCERFETVPILHSFLMDDPTAMKMTIDFLRAH